MKARVKITVMKRLYNEELVDAFTEGEKWPLCDVFSEGQEFVSNNVEAPEGFCSWAWADIQKYVMALARGANFAGVKPGVHVSSCTDGFRPVIFKLERI